MTLDPIAAMDVTDLCEGLNLSPEQARDLLREAVAAGLLSVVAITDDQIVLRGEFPNDTSSNERTA